MAVKHRTFVSKRRMITNQIDFSMNKRSKTLKRIIKGVIRGFTIFIHALTVILLTWCRRSFLMIEMSQWSIRPSILRLMIHVHPEILLSARNFQSKRNWWNKHNQFDMINVGGSSLRLSSITMSGCPDRISFVAAEHLYRYIYFFGNLYPSRAGLRPLVRIWVAALWERRTYI